MCRRSEGTIFYTLRRPSLFFYVIMILLLALSTTRKVTSFAPLSLGRSRAVAVRVAQALSSQTRKTFLSQPKRRSLFLSNGHLVGHRGLSSLLARTAVSEDQAHVRRRKSRPYRLVIVESPSKCKTIESILQESVEQNNLPYDFVVESCKGHIRDLWKSDGRRKKKDSVEQKASPFPYNIQGVDLYNNYRPEYVIIPEKQNVVRELSNLAEGAEQVLLATDPDREGEAMAWHLMQVLSESPGVQLNQRFGSDDYYRRVSFTEITKSAVLGALEQPTLINPALVQAQETRRVLDRLAGFTVSPLLWKKIAPGLSAGRVQSVGLALAVQRERERMLFEPTSYAAIDVVLEKNNDKQFNAAQNVSAYLHSLDGTPLALSGDDFESRGGILKEKSAHKRHIQLDEAIRLSEFFNHSETVWQVVEVKSSQRKRSPQAPYRTSTLQQDAARKLSMSVSTCMRTAQQLYEQGWISYMRTDSSEMSEEAESVTKATVQKLFGNGEYQRQNAKQSKSSKSKKAKFAQEAHEAIRPAIQTESQSFILPEGPMFHSLPDTSQRLYRMIFQRTLASRMPPLVTNLTQVQIDGRRDDRIGNFRATGSVVIDPGYTKAFGVDDDGEDEMLKLQLPPLSQEEQLDLLKIDAVERETKPPPRYTEASFVKELESLGVGRPSTYARVVQILRDRAYVGSPQKPDQARRGKQKVLQGSAISANRAAGGESFSGGGRGALVPSLPAFAVCSLLENHCPSYVDPSFTARMEERLDKIASDEISSDEERLLFLDEFYGGDSGLAATVKRIEDSLDPDTVRRVRLPTLDSAADGDKIGLFVGPWGPYIQDLSVPDEPAKASLPQSMCANLTAITPKALSLVLSTRQSGGVVLGTHPENGKTVRLKTGRFGSYLQLGDDDQEDKSSHSLPSRLRLACDKYFDGACDEEGNAIEQLISFEDALAYVSLPRTVAFVGESQTPVLANIGPYGPYLKVNSTFTSLTEEDGDVLTIDAETALEVIEKASPGKGRQKGVIADLGEKDGEPVLIKSGRYGPYATWNRVNAGLPKSLSSDPSSISLEEAWELLEPKIGAAKGNRSKGRKKEAEELQLPPKPKRPLSAYMHFSSEKRPELAALGTLSFGEIAKEISRLWAEADEGARQKYIELANDGKKVYESEKLAWEAKCVDLQQQDSKARQSMKKTATRSNAKNKLKVKKKSRNASSGDGIKRPRSAYLFFCSKHRSAVSSRLSGMGEITKELARLWAETDDRSEYEKMAADDKDRYRKEKQEMEGALA